MVALLFPWPVAEAVAHDAKDRTSPSSTNSPYSSRSVSEDEQSEVVDLSSLDEEIELLEWVENARLKAEIQCLARKNLDLRIQALDRENALLRARIECERLARDVADMGEPKPEEAAESGEEASSAQQLVEKMCRSSRRRAMQKKANVKTVGTAAFHAPPQNPVWHPWMGWWQGMVPFQPGWQVEPGMTAVEHDGVEGPGDVFAQEVDDEPVVILDDSAEEEEEEMEDDGDDDDDDVEIIEEDGVCQAAE